MKIKIKLLKEINVINQDRTEIIIEDSEDLMKNIDSC